MESRWFSVTFVDAENWSGYANVCCHHKNIKGEAMSIANKMVATLLPDMAISFLLALARKEAKAENTKMVIRYLDAIVNIYETRGE